MKLLNLLLLFLCVLFGASCDKELSFSNPNPLPDSLLVSRPSKIIVADFQDGLLQDSLAIVYLTDSINRKLTLRVDDLQQNNPSFIGLLNTYNASGYLVSQELPEYGAGMQYIRNADNVITQVIDITQPLQAQQVSFTDSGSYLIAVSNMPTGNGTGEWSRTSFDKQNNNRITNSLSLSADADPISGTVEVDTTTDNYSYNSAGLLTQLSSSTRNQFVLQQYRITLTYDIMTNSLYEFDRNSSGKDAYMVNPDPFTSPVFNVRLPAVAIEGTVDLFYSNKLLRTLTIEDLVAGSNEKAEMIFTNTPDSKGRVQKIEALENGKLRYRIYIQY